MKLFILFLFFAFLLSVSPTIALEKTASPEAILNQVAPKKLRLSIPPKDFIFNSAKHKRKTLTFWKGDLNHDGQEDAIICAIQKVSEIKWDGYLLFATFENNDWKFSQIEKFPWASGPSLKDFSKDGYLVFFESFAGNPPLKIVWNTSKKKYELQDVSDSKIIEL